MVGTLSLATPPFLLPGLGAHEDLYGKAAKTRPVLRLLERSMVIWKLLQTRKDPNLIQIREPQQE